jgi:hypothetical protein
MPSKGLTIDLVMEKPTWSWKNRAVVYRRGL